MPIVPAPQSTLAWRPPIARPERPPKPNTQSEHSIARQCKGNQLYVNRWGPDWQLEGPSELTGILGAPGNQPASLLAAPEQRRRMVELSPFTGVGI
ncbi:uncharacterized protein EHS24_005621 [Apiotrichum porosum]|uniref:Uncharacterized protein n=1 Tax=Apiotrichum porosum TaxID=105984 RepID=A0A427XZ54_9TREE|nr:uncharacterized protein EHS24_005621 [Apiotrichum porosum]RSH84120.1 hypothetical protein EHS24_005621 [Apiotrichum porosum]